MENFLVQTTLIAVPPPPAAAEEAAPAPVPGPGLDDCLYYLVRAGYAREAGRACGVTSVSWRLDANLWRALAWRRHGPAQRSRLHWACMRGLLPRVVELLEWGSDIEAEDAEGLRPLHLASVHGCLAVARELLSRGARVGAATATGRTPLHEASAWGRVEVARLLIDGGADVEARCGATLTPLHVACVEGRAAAAQFLVVHGGADVEARAGNGATALVFAAQVGHEAVLRALLAAGAVVGARREDGLTALHCASQRNNEAELAALLEHANAADVALLDNRGRSARDIARTGAIRAKLDFAAGADDINAVDSLGDSQLQRASRCGDLQLVRELVRRGARVAAETAGGRTALHNALLNGHSKVAEFLLDNGANPVSKVSKDGNATPLHAACFSGAMGIVRMLLARGADVHARMTDGMTPLLCAAKERDKLDDATPASEDNEIDDGVNRGHIVCALVAAGADVMARAPNGLTALHLFGKHGVAWAAMRALLSSGPDVNAQDALGSTPLHMASEAGLPHNVALLIDAGADINMQNNKGESALQLAERTVPSAGARSNGLKRQAADRARIVELLLLRGARKADE